MRWFTSDSVGAWTMHPLLDGPRVYFSRDHQVSSGSVVGTAQLRALDRATGKVLWSESITSAANAALAGDVVGAVWGSLPLFERVSGARRGVFAYGATSLNSNVVSDGERFYVGSADGHVLAVEPHAEGVQWDTDLAGGLATTRFTLALSGETLAVGAKKFHSAPASDSGMVAVLDRATGEERWRVTFGDAGGYPGVVTAPVIAGGLVIVATERHQVHAYGLQTGASRWRRSVSVTEGAVDGSSGLSACGEALVIAATGDRGLVAIEAETGATRWRLPDLGDGSLRSLECSYGTVIALASSMWVFDARTGALRARYPLRVPHDPPRRFYITSATRDEESLYVGSTFGYAKIAAP